MLSGICLQGRNAENPSLIDSDFLCKKLTRTKYIYILKNVRILLTYIVGL